MARKQISEQVICLLACLQQKPHLLLLLESRQDRGTGLQDRRMAVLLLMLNQRKEVDPGTCHRAAPFQQLPSNALRNSDSQAEMDRVRILSGHDGTLGVSEIKVAGTLHLPHPPASNAKSLEMMMMRNMGSQSGGRLEKVLQWLLEAGSRRRTRSQWQNCLHVQRQSRKNPHHFLRLRLYLRRRPLNAHRRRLNRLSHCPHV